MARSNLLRRVRDRVVIETDLIDWRRALAPLRAANALAVTRDVLFCDLMAMTATAKVEALFAGVLRLKGYRPIVLLERPDRPIEEIFRAAVPEVEFIALESAIDVDTQKRAEREAAAILARISKLQDLVKLEIDGFRIGRNVQSLVLRQFRIGRLDDDNPRHRDATGRTLARSLAVKAFITHLLTTRQFEIAVFNERGYTPAGEVFDGCLLRGVDVMQWCGAPQSDRLIYRRYNVATRAEHPLTLSDSMWHQLLKMPWTTENDRAVVARIAANYQSGAWYNRQQLQEGKAIVPVDELRAILGLDPTKKTAVVFTHILYDATFFYGDSLFEDYEQWLIETVRAAIANPRLNWVIKVHPVNVWRSKMDGAPLVQLEAETLRKRFGELPVHVKLMPADTGINTFSLFDVTDYGLTVRGTVGMELPCFGIPVVTAGTGRYSGRGFTNDPVTRADYMALLTRLETLPRLDDDAIRRARLHYYGALELRPVPMRSFMFNYRADGGAGGAQKYNLDLLRRADESLLVSEDLGRFAQWLAEAKTPELLSPEPPTPSP